MLDTTLDEVVNKYNLITDNRGHSYFTKSNEYAAAVADEISIPPGDAQSLYFLAQDHIRRNGGYDNPADNLSLDEDGTTSLSLTAALVLAFGSAVFA